MRELAVLCDTLILLGILYVIGVVGENKSHECFGDDRVSGENIIFRDKNSNTISLGDLKDKTGNVSFNAIGNKKHSLKADQLHKQGRQAGQSGDYHKSIALSMKANAEDPLWEYPLYDAAYTYMLKGDSAKALELYQLVENTRSPYRN